MNKERLQNMQSLFAVSGEEERMKELFRNEFQKNGFIIAQDRLSSVFGIHQSAHTPAYTVMVSSPLDRLGLMISAVHADGTLGFLPLEAMHPASLLHQRVQILTRAYTLIEGVICDYAHRYTESYEHAVTELCIDTGRTYEEIDAVVTVGDLACIHADMEWLDDHHISGVSLYPTVLNEVVLEAAEELGKEELPFTLALGGIGQSQIGYRGTKTITHVLQPDVAIVLTGFDGRFSNDGKKSGVLVGALDKGMIPNRRLYQDVVSILHPGVITCMHTNDGSFIHKTQKGAAAVSMGLLIRNMGTAVELVDVRDIEALKDALCMYLRTLTVEKIEQFTFGRKNEN